MAAKLPAARTAVHRLLRVIGRLRRAGAAPLLWAAGAALAALAAAVLLLPVSSPRAAGADDAAAAAPAPAGADFGAATPTEKFVQSFQQQVTRQLQSALAQSSETQEGRLRGFEEQQRQLSEQLQAIEQSVQAGALRGGAGVSAPYPVEVEPPRVNVRRAGAFDPPGDAAPAMASLLPGALPQADGGAPHVDAERFAGAPEAGDAPGIGGAFSAVRRGRGGDANIAPHGFIEGRLLNGVVAILGGPERESIVALSGDYQSANGFVSHLDGCMALVQGRPEIAAGRIDFKLSRLTCNFADGGSRTWDAAGWLVDADGIRGVRAAIVDNTGRKAGVAAAGGRSAAWVSA